MFSFIPQLISRKKPSPPRSETHPLPWPSPGQPSHFTLTRDTHTTLRIRIDAQACVWVKAPRALKQHDILTLLARKKNWIQLKQKSALQRPKPQILEYLPGQNVYYLGRPYALVFLPLSACPHSKTRATAQLHAQYMHVYSNNPTPDIAQRLLAQWYARTAKIILTKRLNTLINRHKLPRPQSLKIRSLKARWGSCTHNGQICLAWQLLSVPLPCLDFVLIHELCHLVHLNHAPQFHALLQQYSPYHKLHAKNLALWQNLHPRLGL